MSGLATHDDAGYVPFGDGLLLQSADFFTPIVDDPYRFGQVAAANAFSDIYAMGGRPLTAINLVGFPCSLDLGILREILAGGMSKIQEADAKLCGGHSLQDEEPKYGLSVTGWVEGEKIVRNAGAQPGDALILTKPLGIGILTTALKRDLVSEADIEEVVETASRLNRSACEAMQETEVSAATDVTGYGFLGHLLEMLDASGSGALVHLPEVPVWERATPLAADGCYPGGLESNREFLREHVSAEGATEDNLLPLYDPQTSGGLLIAIADRRAGELTQSLRKRGDSAAVVGKVVEGSGVRVTS